jgi:hypothetical protein
MELEIAFLSILRICTIMLQFLGQASAIYNYGISNVILTFNCRAFGAEKHDFGG